MSIKLKVALDTKDFSIKFVKTKGTLAGIIFYENLSSCVKAFMDIVHNEFEVQYTKDIGSVYIKCFNDADCTESLVETDMDTKQLTSLLIKTDFTGIETDVIEQ